MRDQRLVRSPGIADVLVNVDDRLGLPLAFRLRRVTVGRAALHGKPDQAEAGCGQEIAALHAPYILHEGESTSYVSCARAFDGPLRGDRGGHGVRLPELSV